MTMLGVAREASVHPELVRYYFGNRAGLLNATLDHLRALFSPANDEPRSFSAALMAFIEETAAVVAKAPFILRMTNDELPDECGGQLAARVSAFHLDRFTRFRALSTIGGGLDLTPIDALFLYITIVGAAGFWMSASGLIQELLPPDTDWNELSSSYRSCIADLVMNGLRTRRPLGAT